MMDSDDEIRLASRSHLPVPTSQCKCEHKCHIFYWSIIVLTDIFIFANFSRSDCFDSLLIISLQLTCHNRVGKSKSL